MSKTEKLVERRVIYALEMESKLYVVENVSVRVDEEASEQFFASQTVDRLGRETILNREQPGKIV